MAALNVVFLRFPFSRLFLYLFHGSFSEI